MAAVRALASAPRRTEADQRFRWTREQYDRMVDSGILTTDHKVELLDGEIVATMPQNRPHRIATVLVGDTLRVAFGRDVHIQEEKPVALSDVSEPEPDIAVVSGSPREYDPHPGPEATLLLVEVSDSSLIQDRVRKASLYAEAGIAEYWIADRVLEVHRDPAGDAYRTKTTLAAGETVPPLARPEASVAVADLLP